MYRYKRNGFTLVELMAVIIIISLIALLTFPNIINQIKKTKKSNNKMIEDVVIEQAKKYVNDNPSDFEEDEYCLPIDTLLNNEYVKEDLVKDINNKVIHLTLDDNKYEVVDKDKCVLSAVKYLLKKTNPKSITNYTDGDIHEMYTFEHEATEQTPALRDYRYIGSDPNNYVEFNNELWRIIGIFKVQDENGKWEEKIKLIRNDSLGRKKWYPSDGNEWAGSTIQVYLNETYIIDNSSQKMIDIVKWYLGGRSGSLVDGERFYLSERSENTYSGRSKNWNGKIGLMYPSDYIYTYSLGVDDICYNTPDSCGNGTPLSGWIYLNNTGVGTMTHRAGNSYNIFFVSGGNVRSDGGVNTAYETRPTLYLSSKVKITSGDGSIDNVYKLSM